MVEKECSMGGFNLRKCPSAGNKRPRVKRTTKPKSRAEDAPKSTRSGRRYGGEGLVYGTEKIDGGMAIPLSDEQKQHLEHYRETHPSKAPPPPSGSPMPTIPLGPMSPNQRSKLRNGHAVRVKMGTGACDECSCKMKEENIKKLMKKKGGAATIKLDEDEKRENKLSGSGIMQGSRGGPRHGGIQAPKGEGISYGGVASLVRLKDVQEGRATMEEYRKSQAAQKKAARELKRRREAKQPKKPAKKRKGAPGDNQFQQRMDQPPEKYRVQEGAGFWKHHVNKGQVGFGIGYGGSIGSRSSSGIANIGAGGNILAPMQASKAPQAGSQNWFFHTQFPPALAHDIVDGRGLIY